MSSLDTLVHEHPLPTMRPIAWTIMALLTVFAGWAWWAQLDEVAVAPAEVVPQGKIKTIQHLEGGIVEEIFVREGDVVKIGDPLVQLDLALGGANKQEILVRIDALELNKARLSAEASGNPVAFPTEVAQRRPDMVAAEERTYLARQAELSKSLEVLERQREQRRLEVEELQATLIAKEESAKSALRQLEQSTRLRKNNLISEFEHLGIVRDYETLKGERDSLTASIPRAEAALAEADQRLEEMQLTFRREAEEELGKVEASLERNRELMKQADSQELRTEIRSPINGVVKNLGFNTIGGVVKPGDPIMEIVPTGDSLVIEAKLRPVDRGYVQVGQKATAKISTYDYSRYGGLDGEVIQVAPDSSTEQDGTPFFRVIVKTEKTYLGDQPGNFPITPGMEATVDIHTGTKSVIDYLVKPVLKLKHEAFRER
jgi:adhesin transport system membrane fusion protein